MDKLTKHERLNFSLISARMTLREFAIKNGCEDKYVIAVVTGKKTSKRVMDAIDSFIKAETEKIKEKL